MSEGQPDEYGDMHALPQQPASFPMPPGDYDYPQRKFDGETMRWQLNAADFLIELEHDLKGEMQNQVTGVWEKVDEPLMNAMGIRTIRSILRTHANKIVFLSKIKEDRVLQFCKEVNHVVVDLLFQNYKKWDVKKENCTLIVRKVCHFVYSAMMRAENEGERKFLGETRTVRELVNNTIGQPIRRGFSIFGGRNEQNG